MIRRAVVSTFVMGLTVFLTACSDGSGGGQVATGEVAVLFTDGPTDDYEQILVSMTGMTLIGPGGQVELYDGPEVTFDVLQMSDWADLAFNTRVLAGQYNKIRLFLSGVTLVDLDAPGQEVILDRLPANGKLDLNPRGPFEVSPDYTTVIKLDVDANRSFQVVETGNELMRFRPVVFVDVFEGSILLDRLVRLFGTVERGSFESADDADPADDSFRLCNLQFVSQSNGPSINGAEECVRVFTDNLTGIFDAAGTASDFTTIGEGDSVTAIGFVTDTGDPEAFLGLDAVVAGVGERQPYDVGGGWDTLRGIVQMDEAGCDLDCFPFTPGSDPTDPAIPARLQPATRVFRADGVELSQNDIAQGDPGSVDAYRADATGDLQASLVVLRTDAGGGILAGVLGGMGDAAPEPYTRLHVTDNVGGMFYVCVDAGTQIVHILADDEAVTLFDLIDPGLLEYGSAVEAFGDPAAGMCDMVANLVIVEAPPLPSP